MRWLFSVIRGCCRRTSSPIFGLRTSTVAGSQVHRLPEDALSRARIAIAMGAPDWSAMLKELDLHRGRVSNHFRFVVFGSGDADRGSVRIDLGRFWDSQAETAVLVDSLSRAGFADAEEASRILLELRASALV